MENLTSCIPNVAKTGILGPSRRLERLSVSSRKHKPKIHSCQWSMKGVCSTGDTCSGCLYNYKWNWLVCNYLDSAFFCTTAYQYLSPGPVPRTPIWWCMYRCDDASFGKTRPTQPTARINDESHADGCWNSPSLHVSNDFWSRPGFGLYLYLSWIDWVFHSIKPNLTTL